MIGLPNLYVGFAESHVELYVKKGKPEKISREKVELQLLNEIEKATFPIEYKMSWYQAVLASPRFDAYWLGVSMRHELPESCTARFAPDQNLVEFEAPTDDEFGETLEDNDEEEIHHDVTAAKAISPTSVPQTPALTTDHGSRPSTADSDDSSQSSSSDWDVGIDAAAIPQIKRTIPKCNRCTQKGHDTRFCPENTDDPDIEWESDASSQVAGGHEAKEYAKRVSAGLPRGPKTVKDPLHGSHELDATPRAQLGDGDGLAREEGDDGSYEELPSKEKGKGKATATPTVKGASKPTGVTKNKATPKKKEQTPAQLKTAAAKTREPPKPKATKTASATPIQAPITPAPASIGNNKKAEAATVPSERDKKLAQIQASMAPAQEAGIKRMLELYPEDEDDPDSPATKKAKTGGVASANGARKKATPKKSNKKKGPEEWDGIPRGFGEY
ncbi:hypothetical protein HO173_006211 [Letharia columbiana]|uniref:Uncharacterized protein n=1 Tax=Letharia columbiana TaxID=112416 RepID=A0A8H6FVI4_9LECA|nr:uncharacterized protein HO173_006211 [Letharia columbiana]KAF6235528.1 hypothetical protein HO173_006211 [Letharia columbiana]